jgi:2-keto-3-deoxy-L-arabinonate dehydratase
VTAEQASKPASRTGFAGIYPVLYAFFDAQGRLDRAAMARQVEACIQAGAHGIAVLGLVTEVHKLDADERRQMVEIVAEAIAGRVPLAVTVAEPTVAAQRAFVRHAEQAGAAWVILQPPMVKGYAEGEYVRFLGQVAAAASVPVAIQNNPTNLDVALRNDSLITLGRNHPNIRLLKGDVFCGHGGRELMTNLRSGCVGLIPAPELLDLHLRIVDRFTLGTAEALAEAERLHRLALPVTTFMLQSLPLMLTYGKRLMARRLGLDAVHERVPSLPPTEFGLAELERLSAFLGPL